MTDWTVVIPVKGTPHAKSRLGASAALAEAIALDSVEAALGAARVVVVTSATPASTSAVASAPSAFEALGARVVQDTNGGLNAAIALGIAAAGDGPVAVLLGDVPALRPDELAAALVLAAAHDRAMVADADEEGTVLVTALRGGDHRTAFGAGSRAAHLAEGYVELEVSIDSGLRRDVDTPEQLQSLGARLGSRSARFLP